jgi:hypothetical protein
MVDILGDVFFAATESGLFIVSPYACACIDVFIVVIAAGASLHLAVKRQA